MKELETERLFLRYFRLADIDPIHRLIYSDPEVYPFWGGQARSRDEVEERVTLWMHGAQAGEFSNLLARRLGFQPVTNLADEATPVWVLENRMI